MVIYFVEMARTRGGTAPPVAPPRIFINLQGVKVRKVHGGYKYQPPSLKSMQLPSIRSIQVTGRTA